MLQETEIRNKIFIRKNTGGSRQVLLKSNYLRIIRTDVYLEIDCLGDRVTNKRDISTIALFFRKYCTLTGNTRLLLSLPGIWGLDMAAWDLISKEGFFGDYSVAVISTELYQTLLLRELERSNHCLQIFKTKEQAEEWFEMEETNLRSFV